MNWSFIIWFFIGLGIYLSILGVIVLVKYIRNKKAYEKELKEKQEFMVINTKEDSQDGEEEQVKY